MPKFNILVTATASASTTVDIEAATLEGAITKAEYEASTEPELFVWTLDDGCTLYDFTVTSSEEIS